MPDSGEHPAAPHRRNAWHKRLFAFLGSVAVSSCAHASGSFMVEAECREDYATVGEITAGRLHCDVDIVASDGAPFVGGHSGQLSGIVVVRPGIGTTSVWTL